MTCITFKLYKKTHDVTPEGAISIISKDWLSDHSNNRLSGWSEVEDTCASRS